MAQISENQLSAASSSHSGQFVVTRRALACLLGILTGFAWLFPVFGPPQISSGTEGGDSIFRYLRLLLPMAILLFVRPKIVFEVLTALLVNIPRGRFNRVILCMLVVAASLGMFPLFSGFLTGNSTFIISAVLPLTLSCLALLGIILLEEECFKWWVLGVTALACIFLVLGMLTSHFESSTYFGRPRILLGFVHPVSTASAVLGTMIFVFLAAQKHFFIGKPQNRRFWLTSYVLVSLFLLVIAQSRNLLISILVSLACFWIARRGRRASQFSVFLALLLVPMFLYSFVMLGSPNDPVWAYVDNLASGRLGFFQTVLAANFDLGTGQGLFEAGNARLAALADYAGFAATDSVFLSILINYGIFSFLAFIAMLLLIGNRLSENIRYAAPYGALCGVVLFFNLDAQGVTTSNLAVFIVFAFAIRAGVIRPAAYSLP